MPLLSGKELPQNGTSWKILLHNCYLLGNVRAVSLKAIPCVCKVPDQCRQRTAETTPWYLQCGHQAAGKQAGTGEPLSLHSSRHLPWLPWKVPGAGQSRQNGNLAVTVLQDSAGTATLQSCADSPQPQTTERNKGGKEAEQKKSLWFQPI